MGHCSAASDLDQYCLHRPVSPKIDTVLGCSLLVLKPTGKCAIRKFIITECITSYISHSTFSFVV